MANDHLHIREYFAANDVIELTLDKQCNIRFLTDSEYSDYKLGKLIFKKDLQPLVSPCRLRAPSTGYWNVVLDVIGYQPITISHSYRMIRDS